MLWMGGSGNPPRRVLARFCGGAGYAVAVKRETTGEKQVPPTREAGGRFAKGVSGNPRGRPRGSRDQRTVILAQLLDDDGAEIVGQLVQQAKAGTPWAVRLVIERLLPRHERRVSVEIPAVTDAGSVGEAIAAVIDLAAEGQLTLEEARGFLMLIEQQRKAIETNDLAIRLELLESELKGGSAQPAVVVSRRTFAGYWEY